MLHRIKPSGVWMKNVIADVDRVRKEYLTQLHMIVGTRISMKLAELIPSTFEVKWSDALLNNKLVESIVVDPFMPENQAMLTDGETSIIIENIMIEEDK